MSKVTNNSMRNIVLTLFILCILPASALADYSCLNNSTSSFTTTLNISGSLLPISYPQNCPYGCYNATGECNNNPFDVSTMNILYLIFPIIAFVLFYFSSLLKTEDWAIHLLLIIAGLLFIMVPLGILSTSMPTQFVPVYWMMIAIIFIVVAYYILKIIARSIQAMSK
jgi:hypothetical protein